MANWLGAPYPIETITYHAPCVLWLRRLWWGWWRYRVVGVAGTVRTVSWHWPMGWRWLSVCLAVDKGAASEAPGADVVVKLELTQPAPGRLRHAWLWRGRVYVATGWINADL